MGGLGPLAVLPGPYPIPWWPVVRVALHHATMAGVSASGGGARSQDPDDITISAAASAPKTPGEIDAVVKSQRCCDSHNRPPLLPRPKRRVNS